jgi:hypothetical protein
LIFYQKYTGSCHANYPAGYPAFGLAGKNSIRCIPNQNPDQSNKKKRIRRISIQNTDLNDSVATVLKKIQLLQDEKIDSVA